MKTQKKETKHQFQHIKIFQLDADKPDKLRLCTFNRKNGGGQQQLQSCSIGEMSPDADTK